MLTNLAIVMTVVILFQFLFSFLQVRYYQTFMSNLVKKYNRKKGYTLASEIIKTYFFSQIVVIVFNAEKEINEAYYMGGFTIFSTFKPYPEVVGYCLDQSLSGVIANEKNETKVKALNSLIKKYN